MTFKYRYKAHLLRVVDGDTIDVMIDLGLDIHRQERLRFAEINAYERYTIKGKLATEYLINTFKIHEGRMEIETIKTGKFGRLIAKIYVGEGEYLNDTMMKKGHALPYP